MVERGGLEEEVKKGGSGVYEEEDVRVFVEVMVDDEWWS